MEKRSLEWLVRRRLRESPAVALVGPRQCGKTTLARTLGGTYFDLEQESERLRLDLSWPRVTQGRRLVILDEAQAYPEVFSRLRGAIDESRGENGRFVLLGSVAPSLMTRISESLAGRLALVELTPFLRQEAPTRAAIRRHFLVGGYPDGGLLRPRRFPVWQKDYVTLLTQRDLPHWGLPAKPQTTMRLIRMLAAWHGQAFNASRLGQSLGVSYQTVQSYFDYLEAAFLVRKLEPLSANIGKRLVKTPKMYLRDSGLLHALLGVTSEEELWSQPWVGASWEGYVIEQVLGHLGSRGVSYDAQFFRTSDQHEIDLVLRLGRELWAIEVKLTSNPSPRDAKDLLRKAHLIGATKAFLVCLIAAPMTAPEEELTVCNLDEFLSLLPG